MSVKYQDPAYANDRLAGSLVRHEGRPVFVEYIDEESGLAHGLILAGNQSKLIAPYEELDLTPVPLGNVNHRGKVIFARRIPKRRDWRQGLRANNFDYINVIGGLQRGISFSDRDVVNTILGSYPNIEVCINSIDCGEVEGMAFSRYFSIGGKTDLGYSLYYRQVHIGSINNVPKVFVDLKLKQEYNYLREFIQEEMKNV